MWSAYELKTFNSSDIAPNYLFHFFWIYTQKWDCWILCSSSGSFLRNFHTVIPYEMK